MAFKAFTKVISGPDTLDLASHLVTRLDVVDVRLADGDSGRELQLTGCKAMPIKIYYVGKPRSKAGYPADMELLLTVAEDDDVYLQGLRTVRILYNTSHRQGDVVEMCLEDGTIVVNEARRSQAA